VETISIHTPSASYDVLLGAGVLNAARERLEGIFGTEARRSFVVTSPEIWRLWGDQMRASLGQRWLSGVLLVPAGEQHKRFATVERLSEELAQAGADRSSILIAFGGGVLGDITGFLAAIYMRGLDYVQVPTTLLAQVDSSVGGKTGVNLAAGKNLAGAFHHPRLVLADTAMLSTLPERELRAGLFECIKAGLIRNADLFAYMRSERSEILRRAPGALTRVIADSIRVKAEVVGADERESGLRMILNFGHTLGHALEAATQYTALLHGEAVGWGMLAALELSRARGLLSDADVALAEATIRAYGLPELPAVEAEDLLRAAASDKKNRAGLRRFVLLRRIEATVAEDVTDAEILAVARAMLKAEAAAR
jgi:3-dehydroquinate synthase